MTRYITLGLVSLILSIMFGCGKSTKDEGTGYYTIDLDENTETIEYYTDILEIDTIIPLEGKVIGSISKLIYFENKYIIFDRSAKQIFVFSKDGQFLNSIGRQGRGPEEFMSPVDVSVSASGMIYLLDDIEQIKLYNIDGTFAGKIKLPTYFKKCQPLDNGQIALLHPNGKSKDEELYDLFIISETGELISSSLSKGKRADSSFTLRNSFQLVGKEIYVIAPYNDTIYCITDNIAKAHAVIKFQKMVTPDFMVNFMKSESISSGSFLQNMTKEHALNWRHYYESDKHLIFAYIYKSGVTSVFYNKNSHKILSYNHTNLHDPLANLDPIAISGDSIISVVYPYWFKSSDMDFRLKRLAIKYPVLAKKLRELRNNMNIDDNPLVVISKFKDY